MDVSQLIAPTSGALPFGFLIGVSLLRFAQSVDRPRAIIDAYLAWAIISYSATEVFGFIHQIALLPFLILWTAADAWLLYQLWKQGVRVGNFLHFRVSIPLVIVAIVLAITLFIALTAAPNNWDSQTYHLPRIEHWIQDRSLEYYPTSIGRQNDLGIVAEILLLQTRILSKSDFYYLLIQWVSMICSIAAVFRITQ